LDFKRDIMRGPIKAGKPIRVTARTVGKSRPQPSKVNIKINSEKAQQLPSLYLMYGWVKLVIFLILKKGRYKTLGCKEALACNA
jgi:hypothetical protein